MSFCHWIILTYLLTYVRSWALPEKLPIVQPFRKFPSNFKGTRRFITVFTRALHWSRSWASTIQSIPHHSISLRSIVMLSCYLCLCLPSGLLSFCLSHQYPICIPRRPHSCYMPCPSHSPWLDRSNYVWRRVQVMKLLIMQFPPISRHSVCIKPVVTGPVFHCMLIGIKTISAIGMLWKLWSNFTWLHHKDNVYLRVCWGRSSWYIGKRRLISRQVWNLPLGRCVLVEVPIRDDTALNVRHVVKHLTAMSMPSNSGLTVHGTSPGCYARFRCITRMGMQGSAAPRMKQCHGCVEMCVSVGGGRISRSGHLAPSYQFI
jgi:hypothetical protein